MKLYRIGLALMCLINFSLFAEEQFAKFGTNKVAYVSEGEGAKAIVLIHGWGGSKGMWEKQVEDLRKDFRVVAVDLPGFGKSDAPKMNYTMQFLAEGVNAVLKEAKVSKAVLVGFSMGAPVMTAFYKKYPERVAGLVALDGGLRPFKISKEQLDNLLEPYKQGTHKEPLTQFFTGMFPNAGTEKMRDATIETALKTPARVLASSFENMLEPSWQVEKIEAPVLSLYAPSPFWTEERIGAARELQPKAEVRTVEGTGHFVNLEKPAEVNAALREFAKKVYSDKAP